LKPAPFSYYRARSVPETVARLAELGDGAKILAGGQSLVPMMNFRLARPSALIEHHHGGNSNHQSDWAMSSFAGVDFSKPGRQDVHFTISRDAGKIDCEGFLNNGEGAGIFHFQPDPNYAREMHQLDFPVDEEKQYSMAVQDVSIDFARQMKNEHLTGLDTDKLIAFRIFRVDSAFIEELRAAGAGQAELEENRRRLADAQNRLSHLLIERHLRHAGAA